MKTKSSATSSRTTKSRAKETEGDGSSLSRELEALVGRPLGPTLTALGQLDLKNNYFSGLCATSEWSGEFRNRMESSSGIVIFGEAANGLFGPHRSRLGETADAGPIVYADKQQLPPEIAGRNLAEFLSIWAFVPDFFTLYPSTSDELDELHAELLEGPGADPDLIDDVRAVLRLPGVKRLNSGKELRALLNELLPIARDLWPDQELEEIAPERTRAEFQAAERAAFKKRFAPRPGDSDEGQDFEVTRQRIRAIEAKALRKIVEGRRASGSFKGDVDTEVARMMKISVDDLRAVLAPPA